MEQLKHSHLFFRNFIITHIFVYTSLVVMETATSYVQFYYFSFRYCCAAYFLLLWEEKERKKRRLKTIWRGGGKKIRSGGWEEGYTVKKKVHKEVEKIDIFKCLNCFVLSRRKKKKPPFILTQSHIFFQSSSSTSSSWIVSEIKKKESPWLRRNSIQLLLVAAFC